MFREMRRRKQALTREENIAILQRGTCGTLALAGDDDYPYAVPMNYVYSDGCIYFHCAQSGHKLDAIARNDKASFCVIDLEQLIPDEYTGLFRSVIAFGRIRILDDDAQKRRAMEILAMRFGPEQQDGRAAKIDSGYRRLHMLELKIEHLTGKESSKLRSQE